MTIANPIYDVVFKYLMENEHIARTILSALLKKDIVKVEVRPHEYTNDKRVLSIFDNAKQIAQQNRNNQGKGQSNQGIRQLTAQIYTSISENKYVY